MDPVMKRELKEYYITYGLIAVIIIVYCLMTTAGGSRDVRVLILFGAKVNQLIEAGQYWRLFTCMFLHIGFSHLLFNSYALLALGKFAEKIFGHKKFLLIFLCTGLGGSLLSFFMSPNISAGASGAVFGMLGAMLSYCWKNSFFWQSGMLANFLIVLGVNLVLGFISSGIDNYGHLGGLIVGLILGFLLRFLEDRKKGENIYQFPQ